MAAKQSKSGPPGPQIGMSRDGAGGQALPMSRIDSFLFSPHTTTAAFTKDQYVRYEVHVRLWPCRKHPSGFISKVKLLTHPVPGKATSTVTESCAHDAMLSSGSLSRFFFLYSILRTTSSYSSTPVYKRPRLYAVSVAKRQHRPRPRPRPIRIPTCRVPRYVPWTTIDYGPVFDTIRAKDYRRGFAASNQGSWCTLVCGPAVRHNDGRMLRRTGRAAR
ncbi:uncharacterized protein BDZ83DRAFT_137451 [Colletotrichum acutatum]|uniref:Uncharacterized protein n=1 Tax=Glomerella acutata TaxID=27357 RepID=A0AAD8UPK1_GLOAC|nr:uncharacterized protein BDZ83DRAFT_137451 [Colletotrichum acutatum]KAK1728237.1 hypothetical protein BDZ83DRAFT_137451 [Colletotrichum acutatum]